MTALTNEALAFIKNVRLHEIRVTPDGRVYVCFLASDEFVAKQLQKVLDATVKMAETP